MVKIQVHPQGTRVRVRQGRLPLDPALEGRPGTVVHLLKGGGDRYGVQLDGESRISVLAEDELEALGPDSTP
ncbi:MAG: hypothetical protein EXR92_03455 [Gemmatimonadetes bacterium]|nr:hypothetical protein [Gemmatimonadota bacterium]